MSNKVQASPENIPSVVDVSDNSTLVYAGSALLVGIHVQTALSAHACPVQNGVAAGGTALMTIAASTAGNTWVEGGNMRFDTGIFVDPDDAATGTITVVYIPDHEGDVGSGAGLP